MLNQLSKETWDNQTAAHLLNRAGFGGPPEEVAALANMGLEAAVSSLLDYERIPDSTPDPAWAKPDPDGMRQLADAAKSATGDERRKLYQDHERLQVERLAELRAWWLNRMAKGPRPFQEKMVLFWHGHFATSAIKVRDAYYMWRQNELFRRLATGNWQELLSFEGKDPAMLIWLDQDQSRQPHPNENFARELMELFALGIGNYTEKDVTEGARALTGWSLDRQNQEYIYRPFFHDKGIKTFLGQTGEFDGDDVIRIVAEQPASARFITGKMWNFFAGQMPSAELNNALAETFRAGGSNFKPFLRVMFSSEEFYAPDIMRNQVKSPTQWLIGSVRMLQCDPPPAFISMAILRSLGQDLLAPPNVKGWDGGIAWITTNTLLERYNAAATIIQGTTQQLTAADFANRPGGQGGNKLEKAAQRIHIGGIKVENIVTPDERSNKEMLIASLQQRLLQSKLSSEQDQALRDFLDSRSILSDADIANAIRLVMSTPEFQVT